MAAASEQVDTAQGAGAEECPASPAPATEEQVLAELSAHASTSAVLAWKDVAESHRRALLGATAMAVATLPSGPGHDAAAAFVRGHLGTNLLALPETAGESVVPIMGDAPQYSSGLRTNAPPHGGECPFALEVPVELRRMFLVALMAQTMATGKYTAPLRVLFQRLAALLHVPWALVAACEDALVLRVASSVLEAKSDSKGGTADKYRWLKVASVGVVGGAAIVLTAGIAAPAVLAGVGVLGAAMGGAAAATTGTVVAFFSGTVGSVLLLSMFGAAGTSLASWRMNNLASGIKVFSLRRLSPTPARLQAALNRQSSALAARAQAAADAKAAEERAKKEQAKAAEGKAGSKTWYKPWTWVGGAGGKGESADSSSAALTPPPAAGGAAQAQSETAELADRLDLLSDDEVPAEEAAGADGGKPTSKAAAVARAQSGGMHVFICLSGMCFNKDKTSKDFDDPWGGVGNRLVRRTNAALARVLHSATDAETAASEAAATPGSQAPPAGRLSADQVQSIVTAPEWEGRTRLPTKHEVPSGWLRKQCPYGEVYSVTWEPAVVHKLTENLSKWLQNLLVDKVVGEILKRTVLSALLAAWQLPSTVLWGLSWIDAPFTMAVDRADKAGVVLADMLQSRVQGNRPVTLVGYSLGARTIFKACTILHKRWLKSKEGGSASAAPQAAVPTSADAKAGKNSAPPPPAKAEGDELLTLIQDVIVAGAPVTADPVKWRAVRNVATGRVVNAYSSKDYVLAFIYRAGSLAWHVAGVGPVGISESEELTAAAAQGKEGPAVEASVRSPSGATPEGQDEPSAQAADKEAAGAGGGQAGEGGGEDEGFEAAMSAAPPSKEDRASMVAAAEAALAQAPPEGAAGAPSDRQQPEALQALLEEGATSQETKQPTGPDADAGGEELDTTEADVDPLAGAAATAHGSPVADGEEVGGEGDEAEASGSLAKALGRVKCQWYEGIESWDVASIVGSHLDYHHRMAVICAAVGLDAPPPIPPRK